MQISTFGFGGVVVGGGGASLIFTHRVTLRSFAHLELPPSRGYLMFAF